MTNRTSFNRKFPCYPLALALVASMAASGCGGGSSDDQSVVYVPVTQTELGNSAINSTTDNNATTGTTDNNATTGTTDNNPITGTTDNNAITGTTDNNTTTGTTDNNATTGNIPVSTNVQQYEDAFVLLNYPEGWILDTSSDSASAQFLDPNLNEEQGQNNCGLLSDAVPNSNLVEITAGFLSLYDENPAPDISFVNVNGVEMTRIKGTISLFGVVLESNSQIAYENQIAHAIQCVGNISPEDIALIFDSLVIR